jgi:hemolysin activation/secretion protein
MSRSGRAKALAGLVVFVITAASSAAAQDSAAAAAAQAEAVRRQAALQRPDGALPMPAGTTSAVAPEALSSPAGAPCVAVDRIVVRGATLLSPDRIAETVSAYEGRCLGLVEINSVLGAVTFAFVEAGWIATRVYLPEQDLGDGTLQLAVLEGALEKIAITGDGAPAVLGRQAAGAFPGMVGQPLNLRDIEQGLGQMNRLRSVEAQVSLAAGREEGGSVLEVTRSQGRRLWGTLSFDNAGIGATGLYESSAVLGIDDPFGLNDAFYVRLQRSMVDHPLNFGAEDPSGWSGWLGYEVPYGVWTVGFDAGRSGYRSAVPGTTGPIDTSGGSDVMGVRVERMLYRDAVSVTSLEGSLVWTDNENAILGTRIEASSYALTVARLALSRTQRLAAGESWATVALEKGLDLWGAPDDDVGRAGSPAAQFLLGTLEAGLSQPFGPDETPWLYEGRLVAQWSDDVLYGGHQIGIGGPTTVHGSRGAKLYGNRGAYLRNEVSRSLVGIGGFDWLSPYAGFDVGWVQSQPDLGLEGGTLTGAVIGLRGAAGQVWFEVSYARFVSTPDYLEAAFDDDGLALATLSVRF